MNAAPASELRASAFRVIPEAIAHRDFERLNEVFAPFIEFQALTPGGLEQASQARGAVAVIAGWFGNGHDLELVSADTFAIGTRFGLRYRLRWKLGDAAETASWYLIEQDCFGDLGPAGIERLSLVCSGPTAELSLAPGAVHVFDAGDLGCADGLPQEFLRQVRAIEIGDVLHVITRDPSARQDLPSLARMNGHQVAVPEQLDDGRTLVVITRRK